MPKFLLWGALAALALAPAVPAHAQPDLPFGRPSANVCRDFPALCPVVNDPCMRNYEHLEGDLCVPVEDDTGTIQFVFDQV